MDLLSDADAEDLQIIAQAPLLLGSLLDPALGRYQWETWPVGEGSDVLHEVLLYGAFLQQQQSTEVLRKPFCNLTVAAACPPKMLPKHNCAPHPLQLGPSHMRHLSCKYMLLINILIN